MTAAFVCLGCRTTFSHLAGHADRGIRLCPDCTEAHLEWWAASLVKGYDRKRWNDWGDVAVAFWRWWGGDKKKDWGIRDGD